MATNKKFLNFQAAKDVTLLSLYIIIHPIEALPSVCPLSATQEAVAAADDADEDDISRSCAGCEGRRPCSLPCHVSRQVSELGTFGIFLLSQ